MPKLKRGDRVDVYQMWITREEHEGLAKLEEWIGGESTKGAERWWVSFPSDGDGGKYFRTVWVKDKQ